MKHADNQINLEPILFSRITLLVFVIRDFEQTKYKWYKVLFEGKIDWYLK